MAANYRAFATREHPVDPNQLWIDSRIDVVFRLLLHVLQELKHKVAALVHAKGAIQRRRLWPLHVLNQQIHCQISW